MPVWPDQATNRKVRHAYESRKNIALAYKEERMQQAPNHCGAMEKKKRGVSSL